MAMEDREYEQDRPREDQTPIYVLDAALDAARADLREQLTDPRFAAQAEHDRAVLCRLDVLRKAIDMKDALDLIDEVQARRNITARQRGV